MNKVTNTVTSYKYATFLINFFVIFDQFCVKVGFNFAILVAVSPRFENHSGKIWRDGANLGAPRTRQIL